MDVNSIFLAIAAALVGLVLWMIKTATNAATAQSMVNSRFAELEKANAALETEVKELRTSDASGKATIQALEGTVTAQSDRIDALERQSVVKQTEIDKKEAINAAQVVEIARLNAKLLEFAAAAVPPGFAPQVMMPALPPAPAVGTTPEAPLHMTIDNPDSDPVPTTDMPAAPAPDAHGIANSAQIERSAAELTRRLADAPAVVKPPDEGAG